MADQKIQLIIEALDKTQPALNNVRGELGKLDSTVSSMVSSFKGLGIAVAAAFAAAALSSFVKETALLAARVETLGVVLGVVGKNAGYSSGEMQGFVEAVKKSGITTQEATNSVIKLAQAKVDLTNAEKLARIAQDAAVIGNINSSEAFGRMIYGIQSGQVEVLRTIGINVTFESSYLKLARTLGTTTQQLTEKQKADARVNAVMEAGAGIAGSYEAAMGTAGKQLTSLARYAEEAELSIGKLFTPALTTIVADITTWLKKAGENLKSFWESGQGDRLATGLKSMATSVMDFGGELIKALAPLGKTALGVAEILLNLKPWEPAIILAGGALKTFAALLQPIADLVGWIANKFSGMMDPLSKFQDPTGLAKMGTRYATVLNELADQEKRLAESQKAPKQGGLIPAWFQSQGLTSLRENIDKLRAEKEALERDMQRVYSDKVAPVKPPAPGEEPPVPGKPKKGRSLDSSLRQFNIESAGVGDDREAQALARLAEEEKRYQELVKAGLITQAQLSEFVAKKRMDIERQANDEALSHMATQLEAEEKFNAQREAYTEEFRKKEVADWEADEETRKTLLSARGEEERAILGIMEEAEIGFVTTMSTLRTQYGFGKTFWDGLGEGLAPAIDKMGAEFRRGAELARGFRQSLSNTITDIATDFFQFDGSLKSFQDYWKNFWDQMANVLANYFTSKVNEGLNTALDYIYKNLSSWVSSVWNWLSSINWSSVFSGISSYFGGGGGGATSIEVHEGGMIMHSGGAVMRFHSGGLADDERRAILQTGEGVLSRQGMENLGALNSGKGMGGAPNVTINIENRSSAPVSATQSGPPRTKNDQYIVDVILQDIRTGGRLRGVMAR